MEWRPIPGWALYEVSDDAVVRNVRTGKPLRRRLNPGGYAMVTLHVGKRYDLAAESAWDDFLVSRIVCMAFHGPPPSPKHEAAHGDNDPANNRPGNLRWATSAENKADKKLHGTEPLGEQRYGAILTEDGVREIRSSDRTQGELARIYGIARATVGKIKRREKWKHVE